MYIKFSDKPVQTTKNSDKLYFCESIILYISKYYVYLVTTMEGAEIPTLDLSKVLSGGLMQDVGALAEQCQIGLTFPPPGIVVGNHFYIPVLPPLPLLPVIIVP
jgi:hypothetical protein